MKNLYIIETNARRSIFLHNTYEDKVYVLDLRQTNKPGLFDLNLVKDTAVEYTLKVSSKSDIWSIVADFTLDKSCTIVVIKNWKE